MYAVHAPKKEKNTLTIKVDPFPVHRGSMGKSVKLSNRKKRKKRVNDKDWKHGD